MINAQTEDPACPKCNGVGQYIGCECINSRGILVCPIQPPGRPTLCRKCPSKCLSLFTPCPPKPRLCREPRQ